MRKASWNRVDLALALVLAACGDDEGNGSERRLLAADRERAGRA